MENVEEIKEKLQEVLKGFLKPAFMLTNDVYLEMLITHLSGKGEKDYSGLLQSPFIIEWIEEYLKIVQGAEPKKNAHVTSFMLKLCALVIQNEWLLIAFKDHELGDKIQNFLQQNKEDLSPSVKLGHVHFLAAISKHSLGLSWIKKTGSWREVIDYCQKNQTVYVVRDAMALIYDILYKFSAKVDDEELCVEMLTEIMKPIVDNVFDYKSATVHVDNLDLQRELMPTLNLICYILQKTLESETKTKIAYYLEHNFKLEINMWKLVDMTQNHQFLGKILRTNTSLNYAKLVYEKLHNNSIPAHDFNQFGVTFFNLMKFCIMRRSSSNILMLAELNHVLWKKLGLRAPEEILIENERIKFENQLITFHIMPVLFVFRNQNMQKLELLDNYIMKLLTISCEHTLRICYAFRDVLFECPDIVADLAYKSIHGILSMENILDQDRAVIVFQAMMYALKEFIPEVNVCTEKHPKSNADILIKTPNLLSAVLVGLHTLVHRYRITWKESIESTCLLNFILVLLQNPNLISRLAVQAIKLTQLSIEHFLSPNLALLVDNLKGSGMENLGPTIMKRLHDNNWEVRDSTLELVTSISSISRLKFPAFQQHILDHGICAVVFSMAKNDSEPYVRASAYKCLDQMVMINMFWDKCLFSMDLMGHALTALYGETEGVVRRETAQLISNIYEHRKIANNNMDILFSTFANAAVNDLDWEVKRNALYFWKRVICRHFQNQGMIDGNFPTVTFSKENKKIVNLTEKEILLRIKKILNELSLRGCLGVLLECLDDECDLEVVRVTVSIIKKLKYFLNKHDYLKVIETFSAQNSKNSCNTSSPSTSFSEQSTTKSSRVDQQDQVTDSSNIPENVIESIINAHDISLLAGTYENQAQSNENPIDAKIDENFYQQYAKIKPEDFLKKVYSIDLDAMVKTRTDWLTNTESFDSLLDDMLFSIKTLDVNDADCY